VQRWQKNLYIMWLGAFSSSMCFTLISPFLPLFMKELNVTKGAEAWAGLSISVSFLMNAIMSPVWGSLADRYGRKVMVMRAGVAQAVSYSLQFFVTNPYQLIALRILNGTFSGMVPSCTALAATNTPEEHLGYCLGVLQTAQAAGSICGPLFGGIAAQYLGYRMTFLSAGLWLLLVTIVIWLTVKETAPKTRTGQIHIINDLRIAFSNRMLRAVLLITVFVQASLTVLQPVLSLQVAKLGSSSNAPILAGLIYSLAGFATVIAAPLWAKRARKTGFRPVLLTGLLGATLFNAPMAFVRNLYVFGALRFATGLATAGSSLSENALTAKAVDAEFRGRAFGILASARQMGQMIGPLAGGITGSSMGLEATFIFTTGMLLATLAAAARYLPRETAAGAQQ